MRRTKDGQCDPGRTDETSFEMGTAPNHSEAESQFHFGITPGYNIAERDAKEPTSELNSTVNRNEAVNYLREICGAKVKDDDIAVLLAESEWKVDQTAKKLLQLTIGSHPAESQMSTVSSETSSSGQQEPLTLNVKLAKLPQHSGEPAVLPLLSPKTPHVVSDFLHYGENATPELLQPAVDALGRFGESASDMACLSPSTETFAGNIHSVMDPTSPQHEIHGIGLTPIAGGPVAGSLFVATQHSHDGPGLSTIIEHQRTESLSPSSQGDGHVTSPGYNSGPSLIQEQSVSPSAMSSAFPQRVMSLTMTPAVSTDDTNSSDNKPQTLTAQRPHGSRKKTLSLNPEEREALENLIEDVIMGGVASDESSNCSDSDDDGDRTDTRDGNSASKDGILNKEGLPKIYPAQLKVAVKHMRNLPPRFMRRLENAQKKIDAAERIEAERSREEKARLEIEAREKEQERLKSREDQKREKKKKIRNLLDDLDQYTDEQSVSQSKDDDQIQCTGEDKDKTVSHQEVITEHIKEPESFMESSQPVHIGLSKAPQGSQGIHSNTNVTNDLTQKLLQEQNPSVGGNVSSLRAVNCEDLERELLNRSDYRVPTSMQVFSSMQQTTVSNVENSTQQNMLSYALAGSQDMMDRRTFLSADAPEFVPLNLFSYGQHPSACNFQTGGIHMQTPKLPMQSSTSAVHSHNPHLLLSSPHLRDTKFNPVPKDSSSSISVGMLQTNASSPYSQSPLGRMSPQVVNTSTSQSSLISVSGVEGPVATPPTSQSAGKLPTFVVPKVPTTVPVPQPSAPPGAVPQPPGIAGVIPINPYQIPYKYATAPFPPQPGLPYQPFFPTTNYMPWNEGGSDKLAPRGLIGHHPLIGVPLKASPQMTRKRAVHPHPGPRAGVPVSRANFTAVNRTHASDVKVLNQDLAKKLLLQLFEEGKKVMVLLRGCPGSGKSTLAKEIVFDGTVLSTDDYFMNSQGVYEYDKAKLGDAHAWNQNRAKQALESGTNPVIIDNTNSQSWEMKSYVSLAQRQGYHIEIIEPDVPWKHNAKELGKRNIHGVTLNIIRKMLELYEHNVTLDSIMGVQTPTEKPNVVETQQQNQSEGEQQGQKMPRKRRRKKRKRKHHRSKKDKSENQEEGQKNNLDDSSDDEESVGKDSKALFTLLEKRASLTSNETTTSPRETTPELMERSDLWENTFSDIKEDFPYEQDKMLNISQTPHEENTDKCGTLLSATEMLQNKVGGSTDSVKAGVDRVRCSSSVELGVSTTGINDAGATSVCDTVNYISCEDGGCDSGGNNDVCDTLNMDNNDADEICEVDEVSSNDGDVCCSGNHPSDSEGSDVHSIVAVIINQVLDMVESGINDVSQSQDCAQTYSCMYTTNTEVVNSNVPNKVVSDPVMLNSLTSKCLNNADLPNNTSSGSLTAEDNACRKGNTIDLKSEITDYLQEKVLHVLMKDDLMRLVNRDYLEHHLVSEFTPHLQDEVNELDETEELLPGMLDDLRKALEDITYDTQVMDRDSDIDLDHEYGFEATGKSINVQEFIMHAGKQGDVENEGEDTADIAVERKMNSKGSICKTDEKNSTSPLQDNLCDIAEASSAGVMTNAVSKKHGIYTEVCDDGDSASCQSTEVDCKPAATSSNVNDGEKVQELQYWMCSSSDASQPSTNDNKIIPVNNSANNNEKNDGIHPHSLVSQDPNLVNPKPRRERTGNRRGSRKAIKTEINITKGNCDSTKLNEWDWNSVLGDDGTCDRTVNTEENMQSQRSDTVVASQDKHHGTSEVPISDLWKTTKSETPDARTGLAIPDVREKRLSQNWNRVRASLRTTSSASSQVEARDLIFLEKLKHSDLEAVLAMDEFHVQQILQTVSRDILKSSDKSSTNTEKSGSHQWIFEVHRSCQTDKIPDLQESRQDKAVMLQMCFPALSIEDIEHILEQCQDDVEWASNILLDGAESGLASNAEQSPVAFNKTGTNTPNATNLPLPSSENDNSEEKNLAQSEHVNNEDTYLVARDPSSLVMLCHKSLENHPSLSTVKATVQEADEFQSKQLCDVSTHQEIHLPFENRDQNDETRPGKVSYFRFGMLSNTSTESTAADITTANMPGLITKVKNPVIESTEKDKIILKMPRSFGEQLLEMFGPLDPPLSTLMLTDENLNVSLDKQIAKEIHKCWNSTLQGKLLVSSSDGDGAAAAVLTDEALARCLQGEEYRQASIEKEETVSQYHGVTRKKKSIKKGNSCSSCGSSPDKQSSAEASPTKYSRSQIYNGDVALTKNTRRSQSPVKTAVPTTPSRTQGTVPSLRDIMDEEMELEISLKKYLSCQNDVQANKDTMSTRLNWQKLIERFPKVDELVLYGVFQSTGYHMKSTILAIENSLSLQGPPKTVMTPEAAECFEQQMFQQAVEESLKMWSDLEATPSREDLLHTLKDPQYSDLRTEAYKHYVQRQECLQKAAVAHRKGMMQVASYYSQQGELHNEKLREANHGAAEMIVSQKSELTDKSNSIDLHGLSVREAIQVLESVLTRREIEQRKKPDKRKCHLMVVTGRGVHSQGGVPQIRPAVLGFLRKNNYRFSETNQSVIKVHLKYRDLK